MVDELFAFLDSAFGSLAVCSISSVLFALCAVFGWSFLRSVFRRPCRDSTSTLPAPLLFHARTAASCRPYLATLVYALSIAKGMEVSEVQQPKMSLSTGVLAGIARWNFKGSTAKKRWACGGVHIPSLNQLLS